MPNTIRMDLNTTSSVFDDKGVPSATQNWHRFSGFIVKALSVIVVTVLLPLICCRYVPFFKPVGVFVLGRLWDVLNFVILTTAVSIGIINSRRKDITRNKHNVRARRNPGLGATIFGDMEQDDEDELDLHEEEHSTAGSDGQQQKKVPVDDGMKKEHSPPTAGVLQARKLVTSVMSSVTHIASFGSVIERLALNASRSFQQKTNSSSKEQLESAHLTEHTIRSGSEPECESLFTKSHIRSSSLDRSFGVAPEKAISRSQEGKTTRRKASFSLDYGVGGGSNGQEGMDGSCGAQLKRQIYERDDTLGSAPTTTVMAESKQRSYSISRSVNVIRPSEMNRGGDEEVGTAGGSSPNEANKKFEAFIAKFRAEMRLQGAESRERYKNRLEREAD